MFKNFLSYLLLYFLFVSNLYVYIFPISLSKQVFANDSNFKLIFQNPSYILDKDMAQDTYYCDESKDECKINFKLADNNDTDISSNYYCKIDFSFDTSEKEKCNPNTVIFNKYSSDVVFQVYKTEDNSLVWEIKKTIINNKFVVTGGGGSNTGTLIGSGSSSGGSGTGAESQTGVTSSGTIELGTGGINSGSGETSSGGQIKLEIPNPIIEVQSGLDYSTGNLWLCENEDCKINLTAEASFTGGFLESSYECLWDFGSGSFATVDTDKKCNPGYVSYGSGIFDINLKIYEKGDLSNFKNSNIVIKNIIISSSGANASVTGSGGVNSGTGAESQTGVTSSGTIELGTGGINSGSGETNSGGQLKLEIPNPIIEVQSGLDYSTGNLWLCKNEDCKVNLTAEASFTGGFLESNYECLWDFGSGSFETVGADKKCNPGYVSYGSGIFDINLKIYEKGNIANFKIAYLLVKNEKKFILSDVYVGGGSSSLSYYTKDIIVQNGLEFRNGVYICNDKECKINLKYEKIAGESCVWGFGGAVFRDKYEFSCNPGYIYYSGNGTTISLDIYKDNIFQIRKYLDFTNLYKYDDHLKDDSIKAKITLQGKLADYKQLEGNKLICKGVEKCSVNFASEETSSSLEYLWDFGNGESFNSPNPKSITYSSGLYQVSLILKDKSGKEYIDYFYVEVLEDENIKEVIKIDENIINYLKINAVKVNTKGADNYEWIELKNTGTTKLNLNGLIIDDIKGAGSKAFSIYYDYFLYPGQTKRFYKSQTNLVFGNKEDEVNLYYFDVLIDSLKWRFDVPEEIILNHENINYSPEKLILEQKMFKNQFTLLDIFSNGININELQVRNLDISEMLSTKFFSSKNKNFKNVNLLAYWSKGKQKTSLALVKSYEKELKASITYKILKQKKGLKITGLSKVFTGVVMYFAGDRVNLEIDKEGNFSYYTTNLKSGDYELVFYTIANNEELFLKKSRTISLTEDYINGVLSYLVKKAKANTEPRKSKKKLEIVNNNERLGKSYISNNSISNNNVFGAKIPFILYMLLLVLLFLFGFLVLRKRKLL